jgi:hypothetical protein
LGAGPVGQLKAVQDQLHTWVLKAQTFIRLDFTCKTFIANFQAAQHWLKKFRYVYQMQKNKRLAHQP